MLLSCPNCSSKFNLGNIQVKHVKCPVCYSTWHIEESKVREPHSLGISRESLVKKVSISKFNTASLFKNVSNVLCILLIFLTTIYLGLQSQRYFYCQNQIKIKEVSYLIAVEILQLRCQMHNISDKNFNIYLVKIQISGPNYQKCTVIWDNITLPPYNSSYFSTTIDLPKDLPDTTNITIRAQ